MQGYTCPMIEVYLGKTVLLLPWQFIGTHRQSPEKVVPWRKLISESFIAGILKFSLTLKYHGIGMLLKTIDKYISHATGSLLYM